MNLIKLYIKFLKATRVFLLTTATLILLDMFVFGAWLKNFFVRANTSEYSPFSTDGQSNWILLLVGFIGVVVLSYILIKLSGSFLETQEESHNETTNETESKQD